MRALSHLRRLRPNASRAALAVACVAVAGVSWVASADAATSVEFEPLAAPQRIVDTRPDGITVDGRYQATGVLRGGEQIELEIGGRAGVESYAAAATLNVTAVGATGPGFLTVYPCDQPRPRTSNVNYFAGTVNSNAVFAGLDSSGRACIYALTDVQVIVDVNGWTPAGVFDPLPAPQRIADTRPSPLGETIDDENEATGIVPAGQELVVKIAGRAGIAGDATAVVLNVTVTDPNAPGFVTVYPCGQPRPTSSNVNYFPGDIVSNSVIARLDTSGRICVYTLASAHLIVDVSGALDGDYFVGLASPQRLVDTRPDGETADDDVEKTTFRRAGTTLQFPVTGRANIPPGATAVALNVTAVGATDPGFLTVHPRNSQLPNASNVNYFPGDVVANTVIAAIGGDGMICLFSSADVEVVVDVGGYFFGDAPVDTGVSCPQQFPIRQLWDGYPVGEYQMAPGRYVSETPAERNVWCEFNRREEREFDFTGGNTNYGAGVTVAGRLLADVKSVEKFLDFSTIRGVDSTGACEPLVPYVAPVPAPLATSFGAGDFIVGTHIKTGTYRSTRVPNGGFCRVQLLTSFDGSKAAELNVIDSDQSDNIVINITNAVKGISVSNTCNTFTP